MKEKHESVAITCFQRIKTDGNELLMVIVSMDFSSPLARIIHIEQLRTRT